MIKEAIYIPLLAIFFSAQVLGQTVHSRWIERNEVFFANALFDFERGTAVVNSSERALVDCSDEESFCLFATDFGIKIPKKCSPLIEEKIKSLKNRIIAKYNQWPDHHDINPEEVYVLVNPDYPYVAFEYSPFRGIIGLSYDKNFLSPLPSGNIKINFLEINKDDTYRNRRGRDWSWSNRMSLDSFGACIIG